MPFVITRGLGRLGDGTEAELLVSLGFGDPGPIPVGGAFQGLAILSAFQSLTIELTNTPTLAGPAADPSYYVITPTDGGHPATVTGVSISGQNIQLTTTEHTNAKNYQVTLPFIGIVSISSQVYQGPFVFNYVGVGVAPIAIQARSIDARVLEVVFSEPLNEVEALNPVNYVIVPPLAVVSVVKVLDTIYRITTGHQKLGQVYTVTVSNVHDLIGNPI